MRTVVLGAGITGCSTALELARRGRAVVLVEQDALAMHRASLRNEGKVHLGLVYANDPSLATGLLQLRAALRFRRLLERWLGDRVEAIGRSTPFHYLVAPDSIVGVDAIEAFHARIDEAYAAERLADPEVDYLGDRPERLTRRLDPTELDPRMSSDSCIGAFATAERSIDTDDLAREIRAAVASSRLIEFRPSHAVEGVRRRGSGFVLEGRSSSGRFAIDADQVVNATWERRLGLDLGLDREFGLAASGGVLHRLKYRVIARLPESLVGFPSITMVLGRYGDVVVRPGGTLYLSWYPAGLRGWSEDPEPPRAWDAPCRGEPPREIAAEVARETLAALGRIVPAIARAEVLEVDAGAIVAFGRTDVDEPSSGLHRRTRVGVRSLDGYHSVDPGKLTTAPLFAIEAADAVEGAARPDAASKEAAP